MQGAAAFARIFLLQREECALDGGERPAPLVQFLGRTRGLFDEARLGHAAVELDDGSARLGLRERRAGEPEQAGAERDRLFADAPIFHQPRQEALHALRCRLRVEPAGAQEGVGRIAIGAGEFEKRRRRDVGIAAQSSEPPAGRRGGNGSRSAGERSHTRDDLMPG